MWEIRNKLIRKRDAAFIYKHKYDNIEHINLENDLSHGMPEMHKVKPTISRSENNPLDILSERIIKKYPARIPIIVCKDKNCKLVDIDKQKFLVPRDMNLGQFIYIIRKRIKLESSQALFIMVNNTLSPATLNLGEIYEKQKDKDGFLYITYSSENTFG